MHVLIVGASVAGIGTARALRTRGFTGEITVVGDESHHPYDKPPLSKEMLAPEADGSPVQLLSEAALADFDVSLRLGVRATAVDTTRRSVITEGGEEIGYDTLVAATGVAPRTLPGADGLPNVFTIRTVDDVRSIRPELVSGRRCVVIGAGFIGAEFAAAAAQHGVAVTLVEAQAAPLALQLGTEVGASMIGLHEANGVRVEAGVRFAGFEGSPEGATGVRLDDGRVLPADFVIVGVGARPSIEWLASSELSLDDGIECDRALRAVGVSDVYAAGDIARRHHPVYDAPVRIEHWTNANDHAEVIAADILSLPAPRPTLPYVWSDQYGKRIQIVGRPTLGSPCVRRGDAVGGDLVAGYADEAGTLVGALVIDAPRLLMKFRKAILAGDRHEDFEHSVLAGTPVRR